MVPSPHSRPIPISELDSHADKTHKEPSSALCTNQAGELFHPAERYSEIKPATGNAPLLISISLFSTIPHKKQAIEWLRINGRHSMASIIFYEVSYSANSTTRFSSTATLRGRAGAPKAVRLCLPFSPKISNSKLEAPFITTG